MMVVSSAGNFPEEREQYPAAHDSVFAVTALGQDDKKIHNSNYGAFVDLSAPGIHIQSTSVFSDTGYEEGESTSVATPMVAAAAALVWQQNPSYSLDEVTACLKSSADTIDIEDQQYSAKLGAGKLNIEAAIECGLFNVKPRLTNQLLNPQGYLYLNNSQKKPVSWYINPEGVFKGLRFKPLFIKGDAAEGLIKFYSDDSSDSNLHSSYPLNDLPREIYIPGMTACVVIEPKDADKKIDLLMEYMAEPINFSKLYCRDTVYLDEEGEFEDGSGPDNYSPKSACKWLITAPESKVVHIKFTEFDTEAKIDKIYFFDGAGTHEQIMACFTGPDIPPELTTWRNQVLVWFVTDGQNQGMGWKAEYRFLDP